MSAPNLQRLGSMSTRLTSATIFLLAMAFSSPAAAGWGDGHEILAQADPGIV